MKKLLALLLAVLLTCSLFAACSPADVEEETTETPAVTYDLESAVAVVDDLYREKSPTTSADYDLVSQVMVAGVVYLVDWSVDTDQVTIGEPANGHKAGTKFKDLPDDYVCPLCGADKDSFSPAD